MAERTNIEKFNLYTGYIFAQLYEAFPEETTLRPAEIVGYSDEGIAFKYRDTLVASATISWLAQAEYIWISTPETLINIDARLSPKGLEALNIRPNALESSFGHLLREAAKKKMATTLIDVTVQALGAGARLAINSL